MAADTKPAHTPVPWEAFKPTRGPERFLIRTPGANRRHIAEVPLSYDLIRDGNTEGNARLIAAAPDLLAEHQAWARAFGAALLLAMQGDYSEVDRLGRGLVTFQDGKPVLRSEAIARATPA